MKKKYLLLGLLGLIFNISLFAVNTNINTGKITFADNTSITSTTTIIGSFVSKSGDTMTGRLITSGISISTTNQNSLLTIKASSMSSGGGINLIGYSNPLDISYWSERRFAMSYGSSIINMIEAGTGNTYFTNDGNFGIGTNNPTTKLFVNGDITGTQGIFTSTVTAYAVVVSSRVQDKTGYLAPVGAMSMFAGSVAPTGWLICDGSAISRTTYADLFSVIETAYGVGDGSTTFNIPDIKGKTVVGYDNTQTEFNALGKTGGEKTHLLTDGESGLPAHNHNLAPTAAQYYPAVDAAAGGIIPRAQGGEVLNTQNNTARNASSAHNNLQPYIVCNYIIKY